MGVEADGESFLMSSGGWDVGVSLGMAGPGVFVLVGVVPFWVAIVLGSEGTVLGFWRLGRGDVGSDGG